MIYEIKPLEKSTNVIFAHVPKCAGTTAVASLLSCRPRSASIPYKNLDVFYDWLSGKPEGEFVYGHLRYYHLDALEQSGIDYRLITFVRHPVHRLKSWYRYDASPVSPIYEQFIQQHPDFETWAKTRPVNLMQEFLISPTDSIHDYVERAFDRFDFIGYTSNFDKCMMYIRQQFGMSAHVGRPQNQTIDSPANQIEMTSVLYDELLELNRLDFDFYNKVREACRLILY